MELIYITNKRIPTDKAHGYQISKMCESFARAGARVSLWLPTRVNAITEDLFNFYGVEKNFDVRFIKSVDFIDYRWLGRFGFIFQTAFFLLKLLFVSIPKDAVVYTRNPEIVFVLWMRRRKVVYEDHGWPKKTGLYLVCVRKAYRIVAITKGIKSEYESRGINPEKVVVASDAVDLKEFSLEVDKDTARTKLGLPADKKIVTYTGSFYLYAWKGIDVLLGAEPYLSAETVLVLVGGNDKEMRAIQKQYSLKQTILVSKQPRSNIALYLKASDVLVLPNKSGDPTSEKYTSPLKLFEYMASGTPIVASRLPSITEILNDSNAYIVEPNDSKVLASAITMALEDTTLSKVKAEQARNDVELYTWDNRAKVIVDFICS